jgi:hypothetical protein
MKLPTFAHAIKVEQVPVFTLNPSTEELYKIKMDLFVLISPLLSNDVFDIEVAPW